MEEGRAGRGSGQAGRGSGRAGSGEGKQEEVEEEQEVYSILPVEGHKYEWLQVWLPLVTAAADHEHCLPLCYLQKTSAVSATSNVSHFPLHEIKDL